MKNFFEYLYYRHYSWDLRVFGKEDCPQWTAMLGISLLLGVNFLTLINLYSVLFPDNNVKAIISSFDTLSSKFKVVLSFLILIALSYCWLVKGGKYKMLAAKFKEEDKDKKLRRKRNWQIVIYLVASIGLFIASAFARR